MADTRKFRFTVELDVTHYDGKVHTQEDLGAILSDVFAYGALDDNWAFGHGQILDTDTLEDSGVRNFVYAGSREDGRHPDDGVYVVSNFTVRDEVNGITILPGAP